MTRTAVVENIHVKIPLNAVIKWAQSFTQSRKKKVHILAHRSEMRGADT